MLLTEQNICFYLLDKGYMTAKQLVDSKFRVDVSDSRNRNFLVNRDFDNSYFIKHVKVLDLEKTSTLKAEATCYWLANNDSNYAILKKYIPAYFDFDYNNYILVLGYEKGNINLHDFYNLKGILFESVTEQLAFILSSYHNDVTKNMGQGDTTRLFKKTIPWVFSLGDPQKHQQLMATGKAESQVLKLVNDNQKFRELISGIQDQWEPSSLIHSDIKFPNFLINADYDGRNDLRIKLIDWELAEIGDPCWDVAAIFQSYLTLWVNAEISPQQKKVFSLPEIQMLIKKFWNSYCYHMNYGEESKAEQLKKVISFCALKLIHSCFETTPGAESLHPFGAKLLQLSFNILDDPGKARQQLFGFY